MKLTSMRFRLLLTFILSFNALSFAAQPAAMRLDYYHTGNATQEVWSFDRVVVEPLPWPGDMSKTIDDSNLGNYFFEVRDQATDKLLYSRGFGSLFSEWADTPEAKKLNRTFSESLRFPHAECAGEDCAEGAARREGRRFSRSLDDDH
jgi:peptidase M64-like protein